MSLHQQEFSFFKLTTLEDIKYLASRLRKEDKQEILAGTGLIPYEALLNGYKKSVIVFTIVNFKNEPVAIFGINDVGNNVGAIWLLATDKLKDIQYSFLRENKKVITSTFVKAI